MSDSAIVKLDAARSALAECKTVMEAKQIADVAEAAKVYLERTHASVETVNRAREIRTLAERQMGEFLKRMPKAKGARGVGPIAVPSGNRNEATLSDIGVTKKESMVAQQLADIPADEFQARIETAKQAGEPITAQRIINGGFTDEQRKKGEEAEKESENLWRLKSTWKRTSKKDRKAFWSWVEENAEQ